MAATYESVASAASGTCSKPTGATSGDLLVALIVSAGATAATLAGWNLYSPASGNHSSFYFASVQYRILDGSEGASFTFTSAGVIQTTTIVRVSGFDTTTPLESGSFAGGALVAPTVTVTTDSLLIGLGCGTADVNPPGSMASRADAGPGATYGLYSNTATESPASGATGTRTFTTAGSAILALLASVKAASASPDVTVVVPTAPDANADVLAHTVSAQQNVTLTVPITDANADVLAHTVAAGSDALLTVPRTDANAGTLTPAVATEQNITLTVPVTDANADVLAHTVTTEQSPTIAAPVADANAAVPTHVVTVPLYVTLDVPVIDANATVPLIVVRAERTVPAWAGGGISMDPRETTVTVSADRITGGLLPEPKRIRGTADNRRITGYSRDQGTVTGRQVEN